jgi:hypothetical protein
MDTLFISEALRRNSIDNSYHPVVDRILKQDYRRSDEGISIAKNELSERTNNLAAVMWRLRQQSVVFEVFMALVEENLLNLSGLHYAIDFHVRDDTVWDLHTAFSHAFDFGRNLSHPPSYADCFHYTYPSLWLTTMIVRGALVPLADIVDFIAFKGYLGKFDAELFAKSWPEGKELEINSKAQAGSDSPGIMGLYLPTGMDFPCKLEDIYYSIDEPLRRCEEVFARYFRIPETDFVPAGRIWMP